MVEAETRVVAMRWWGECQGFGSTRTGLSSAEMGRLWEEQDWVEAVKSLALDAS